MHTMPHSLNLLVQSLKLPALSKTQVHTLKSLQGDVVGFSHQATKHELLVVRHSAVLGLLLHHVYHVLIERVVLKVVPLHVKVDAVLQSHARTGAIGFLVFLAMLL